MALTFTSEDQAFIVDSIRRYSVPQIQLPCFTGTGCRPGDTITVFFYTTGQQGELVDPDSLPTAGVLRNGGSADAVDDPITITKLSNSTGQYSATFTLSSNLVAGDILRLQINYTITIDADHPSFLVTVWQNQVLSEDYSNITSTRLMLSFLLYLFLKYEYDTTQDFPAFLSLFPSGFNGVIQDLLSTKAKTDLLNFTDTEVKAIISDTSIVPATTIDASTIASIKSGLARTGDRMDLVDSPNLNALFNISNYLWNWSSRTLSSFGSLLSDISALLRSWIPSSGASGTQYPMTLTLVNEGNPLSFATAWITLDLLGKNKVTPNATSDSSGKVTFYLIDGSDYYLWVTKTGTPGISGRKFTAHRDL